MNDNISITRSNDEIIVKVETPDYRVAEHEYKFIMRTASTKRADKMIEIRQFPYGGSRQGNGLLIFESTAFAFFQGLGMALGEMYKQDDA